MVRGGVAGFAVVLLLGANAARAEVPPPARGDCVTAFALSNGFHGGLILSAADARATGFPDFGGAWVEFGWGEARAYQAPNFTLRNGFLAAFFPGPSAMLIAPVQDRPDRLWRTGVAEFGVSRAGLRALQQDLRDEALRDAQGRPKVLSQARGGMFVEAKTRFRPWRTCNAWAAARLRRAGLNVGRAITAGTLMKRIDRLPTCGELEADA